MPRWLPALWLLATVVCGPATAQIANVQPLLDPARKQGLRVELAGSLELNTGNTRFLQLRTSLLVAYNWGEHGLLSSSSVELISFNDQSFSRVLFSHLRYQWFFHRFVGWEAFTQATNDRLGRIEIRFLLGTGPRFLLCDNDVLAAALGVAYLFERESLTSGAFADGELVERNDRLSVYLTGRISITPLLSVIHTTYLQPRFEDVEDLRVFADTSLVVKLTERVALAVDLGIGYDTRPALSVQKLDIATKVRVAVGL